MTWLALVDGGKSRDGYVKKSELFAKEMVTRTCEKNPLKVIRLLKTHPEALCFWHEEDISSLVKLFEEVIPDTIKVGIDQEVPNISFKKTYYKKEEIISRLVKHFQQRGNWQTWTDKKTSAERKEVLQKWLRETWY